MTDRPAPRDPVDDRLPLTPAAFHILLVLAGGPAHGYAIMQEVAALTGGLVHLGPGTLYRSIQQLLDDALIEEVGAPALTGDDRRTYRLTGFGRLVARAEAERLAALVKAARRRGLFDAVPARRRGATT
jgi:DNA-binding PadR family transcriptional regulator